ncbi:hypothetical protein FYK55_05065 [Roseiconus nitratireducens]|uniref:Nitroreductase family protein n=1 Tax=Roseiconus nitratireducens TaxID=2605748 RepID=A0A5M6DJ67_9BACT|nr:hypothetical protein [Roseiconus nitratireducens]KAA5546259.1 hypothetical protein FYK55_05065 [Roseiconus nitratireducens]
MTSEARHQTKPPSSIIEAMLDAAVLAPSPDNNQPWLYRKHADRIEVFLDTARSLPSDESSMFDLTAIGAAVENAVIAASHHGQATEVIWQGFDGDHPDPTSCVCEIRLTQDRTSAVTQDPLFDQIPLRCTCRKPYSKAPLEEATRKQLEAAISPFPEVQIDWVTEPSQKSKLGKIVASTDALRFRHQPFHEELFRQLRFTPEEAERTRDGLDVRTLELPPGVATVLKSLRSWKVMQALHTLHLTPLLTAPSAQAIKASGAIAFLSVPEKSSEAFFRGGRAIERFWLEGTAADLSMHPVGSPPIFLLQSNPKPGFGPIIDRARAGIIELLPNLRTRALQLAFRVGSAPPPTERSLRLRQADRIR